MSQGRLGHQLGPVLPPPGEHVQLPLVHAVVPVEQLTAAPNSRRVVASDELQSILSTLITSYIIKLCHAFTDCTAHSKIGYWHDKDICQSVHQAVSLHLWLNATSYSKSV